MQIWKLDHCTNLKIYVGKQTESPAMYELYNSYS